MEESETGKNIIWTLFAISIAYGFFVVLLPLKLLSINLQLFSLNIGPVRYCGLIIIIIGAVINLKCYWDLITLGIIPRRLRRKE